MFTFLFFSSFAFMEGTPYKKEMVERWAEKVRNSNQEAYKQLFEYFWETMATYATSIMEDDELAKDLLQDVWLDYWKRRKEVETENIKAYLYTALRNRCYKYLRDNKLSFAQKEVLDKIEYESNVDLEYDTVARRMSLIATSLEKLPKRCKEIFLLSRINGLTNQEIAQTYMITKKTVENQISLAQKKLRQDMKHITALFSIFY